MAASTHNTILLDADLDGILPINGYRVLQDGLEKVYEPAMVTERSLTGALHIHRVMESGSPLVFSGYQYTLFLTMAEKDQIALDLGRVVYFMPHWRDEGDAGYRSVMLFKSMMNVKNIDPMLQYWIATIQLESAEGNEV